MTLPGALVSGWSAVVVDRLLALHLRRYLAVMTGEQRAELEQTRRAVRAAADLATLAETSAGDAAEAEHEPFEGSSGPWSTTSETAECLGLSTRRVRQLAPIWLAAGEARKVGPIWMIDPKVCTRRSNP